MEIIKLKTFTEAKLYFVDNVLPKMDNEDALPVDTLFNIWIENPTDYDPEIIVEVEEGTELSNSDRYDNETKHD